VTKQVSSKREFLKEIRMEAKFPRVREYENGRSEDAGVLASTLSDCLEAMIRLETVGVDEARVANVRINLTNRLHATNSYSVYHCKPSGRGLARRRRLAEAINIPRTASSSSRPIRRRTELREAQGNT